MMMQVLERMNELRAANAVVGAHALGMEPCVLISEMDEEQARVSDGMWAEEFGSAMPFDADTLYTVTIDELRVIALTERVLRAAD